MELAHDWAGEGVPVVCLAAYTTDRGITAAAFDPALAAGGGLRRCYVDLPGHGDTPAGPLTCDGVLDVLSDFLDRQLGGERFLVAGWSFGGYMAAALARRRPADVAGMLLVCPGIMISQERRDLPAMAGAKDQAEPGWLDDVPARLREHLSRALGHRTREMAGRVVALLAASAPGDEEYRDRLRTVEHRLSDEDSAAVFEGPVTIVTGRQDGITGYADPFRRLSCYPAGSFTVLDEAGHYLPFEQPQAFGKIAGLWRERCLRG